MSVTVPRTSFPIFVEPFIGGVFRKYGKPESIQTIIESKRILESTEGDIKSKTNPSGAGTYISDLAVKPGTGASSVEIAEVLRIFLPGSFEVGNSFSTGTLDPQRASSYIDLAIDTRAYFIETDNKFPLQYVIPNTILFFGLPNEKENSILIDRF